MKNFLILLLFIPIISFGQESVEIDLSKKEYNKIKKKINLKIVNRGYDGSGLIMVQVDEWNIDEANNYTKFWNEALFEMDLPTGQVIDDDDTGAIDVDADWIFRLDGRLTTNGNGQPAVAGGGLSGKILDLYDNNKVVATFSTKEKMSFIEGLTDGDKRKTKFKNMVKVIVNEILLSVK